MENIKKGTDPLTLPGPVPEEYEAKSLSVLNELS